MAGGKETPRQKMIGMMYLVLLAMLAMNVSKQIVYAFVTLNDKLAVSENALVNSNGSIYGAFESKIISNPTDKTIKPWQDRAKKVKAMADRAAKFILLETSDVIKEGEGVAWHDTDENGKITLKSLMEIEGKDKFDEAARLFIENKERGNKLRTTLMIYRDSVCQVMGTYSKGKGNKKKDFSFTPTYDGGSLVKFDDHGKIEDISELREALKSANPEDTAAIIRTYTALSLAEEIKDHDGNLIAWQDYTFDHAPVVAAAAILTSLRVDIRNVESMAGEHLLSKVNVQDFKFNKIEPLAFAPKGYINQGDSLNLSVMIAAYDSTSTKIIRYGVDADTLPEKWKQVSGKIGLSGSTPGTHKVKGVIMVEKRGELIPKPWKFSYTVGAPMGIVAQPEMRVLYIGYANVVEGTASGFPADMVTLSGGSGCSLSSKGNGKYIAKVSRGTRKAKISVSGRKDDGTSVSLGSFDFDVRPMPAATAYFGRTENGGKSSYQAAKATSRIKVAYDPSVPLTGVTFTIKGGSLTVSGIPGKGRILAGGALDSKAKSLIKQSRGKTVAASVNYKGPDGTGRIASVIFDVKK